MDDLKALLEKAERVEALGARVYRLLAEGLADRPNAQGVFARLADEEEQHAARIRLLELKVAERPWNPELRLDHAGADALVAEAESLLQKAELDAVAGIDLTTAARLLVESERRLAAAHAHSLVAGDPDLEAFFADLAAQDRTHLEILLRLQEGES